MKTLYVKVSGLTPEITMSLYISSTSSGRPDLSERCKRELYKRRGGGVEGECERKERKHERAGEIREREHKSSDRWRREMEGEGEGTDRSKRRRDSSWGRWSERARSLERKEMEERVTTGGDGEVTRRLKRCHARRGLEALRRRRNVRLVVVVAGGMGWYGGDWAPLSDFLILSLGNL
jgi:hypothetical protein